MMNSTTHTIAHYNQLYSKAVRRYPEYDVATFAAGLKEPLLLMDLGCGTGRNLLPLLQTAGTGGVVLASDISSIGVQQIQKLADKAGGVRVDPGQLPSTVLESVKAIVPSLNEAVVHRIGRLEDAFFWGPNAVFNGTENAVFLVSFPIDMASFESIPCSVDAIVNRGSIFYLNDAEIQACMERMFYALKPGGKLLLTLKSNCDSRYATHRQGVHPPKPEAPDSVPPMRFFERDEAETLCGKFTILSISHLTAEHFSIGLVLADWSLVLQKPS